MAGSGWWHTQLNTRYSVQGPGSEPLSPLAKRKLPEQPSSEIGWGTVEMGQA